MNKIKPCLTLLIIILLITTFFSTLISAAPLKIKWGATSVKSDAYVTAVQFAGYVNKLYPDLVSFTIMETGGFIENLSRMEKSCLFSLSLSSYSTIESLLSCFSDFYIHSAYTIHFNSNTRSPDLY